MSEVPEPTEAMVEAAARSFHEWGDWSKGIVAAFAAAPPEWLLRAALTEEELELAESRIAPYTGVTWMGQKTAQALYGKLDRALYGGEETNG